MSAVLQLIVGAVDNGIAAGIVWVLLPHGAVSYASFIGAYALACVIGLISSVPGGAGLTRAACVAPRPRRSGRVPCRCR